MVGVSGPMFRRSPGEARNFTIGYAIGYLVGGTAIAMGASIIGELIRLVLPSYPRELFLAVVLVALGVLDLADRTPELARQVPQRHARNLPAAWLGLIWGLDLSLLFTTRKTTSLIWAALAWVVLIAPGAALAFVSIMVAVSVGQLLVGIHYRHVPDWRFGAGERTLVRWSRAIAGGGLICLATLQTI